MSYQRSPGEKSLEDAVNAGLRDKAKVAEMYDTTLSFLDRACSEGMPVVPFYAALSNRVLEVARGMGVDTSEGERLRDELNAGRRYSMAKRVCRPCIPDGFWIDLTVKGSFGQCDACGVYKKDPDPLVTLVTPFKVKV